MWHPYTGKYSTTADADPRHLYHNVLIAFDQARKLNNGMPSALAYMIEALELGGGEHVVHIGCGVGYYTAILAEVVGKKGRVTALETDPGLAARASVNLSKWKQVAVNAADGCVFEFEEADALLVNAGATHPMDLWLRNLRLQGRMVLPLTGKGGGGPVMKFKRYQQAVSAAFLLPIAIYPCIGARDAVEEELLERSFRGPNAAGLRSVHTLRTDTHGVDGTCWMHSERYCLSMRDVM